MTDARQEEVCETSEESNVKTEEHVLQNQCQCLSHESNYRESLLCFTVHMMHTTALCHLHTSGYHCFIRRWR